MKLGFKSQLAGAMLIACLIPLIVVSILATITASSSLEEQAFNQLASIKEGKKAHIEKYFGSINGQVKTFSQSTMIIEAMQEFDAAFQQLPEELGVTEELLDDYRSSIQGYYRNAFGAEYSTRNGASVSVGGLLQDQPTTIVAQYQYISNNPNPLGSKEILDAAPDNSTYSQLHAKYHPVIRSFLQEFGYYDIFLINPDKGEIVYSVFKEIDYGTSLKTGPYSSTNFARVFEQALTAHETTETRLVDFESYLPSYDSPASFISSPIFDGDELVGVLVFQMPVSEIDQVMQEHAGLGESGETYLLGFDGLMRSQSRFSEENTILEREIETAATAALRNDESGATTITNEFDEEVLTSYAPVAVEGLEWGMIAEIDKAEALARVASLQSNTFYLALFGLIFAVVMGLVVSSVLFKRLGADPAELKEVAEAIARNELDHDFAGREETARGVFASMITMQQKLLEKERADEERAKEKELAKREKEEAQKVKELAERNTRIREALDKATGNIIVTDEELHIIYLNEASKSLFTETASDIREAYPAFDPSSIIGLSADLIYGNPTMGRNELMRLNTLLKDDFTIGSRIFQVISNPVLDETGKRLGIVMEWTDRTQAIGVEKEVESIVNYASRGELTKRIDLDGKNGFYKHLGTQVNDLVSVAEQVIGDTIRVFGALANGRLTEKIDASYQGAFQQLKHDANSTIEKLTEVVDQIRLTAEEVNEGAMEIASGNTNLSRRTEQQATNLGSTATSMEEMTSTVKQTADNAAQADELAIMLREQAERGGMVVQQAIDAMNKINEASKKISDIIGVIDEIAFQTNLLALNAAVEAARAGEQGRGFAVVASEVRNLAGRSSTAAKEIKDLIEDSSEKVSEGSRLVYASGETLEEIVAGVEKVTTIVSTIAAASQEQSAGIGQISRAIAEMDTLTQQNASLVEEAAESSRSLGKQANGLESLISFFSIERTSDRPSSGQHTSPAEQELAVADAFRETGRKSAYSDIDEARFEEDSDEDWNEF